MSFEDPRIELIGSVPECEVFPPQVPMDDPNAVQFERAAGYQPPELREGYANTRVCIAGVGGAGQFLATLVAKKGCLDIVVADPDVVAPSNSRLPFNQRRYWGVNKAVVAATEVAEANDSTRVRVYPEGVTSENMEDFLMAGLKKGTRLVVFDGIDVSRPDVAWQLAVKTRELVRRWDQEHKFDLGGTLTTTLDISEGGIVTTYNPRAKRYTYERVSGIKPGTTPEQLRQQGMDLTHAVYLPRTGSLSTLLAVKDGAPMPTTEESVLVATALGINELNRCVLYGKGTRYPEPTFAPRARYFDALTMASGETRFRKTSHYRHLMHAILRDKLGLNPETRYALEDIDARGAYRAQYAREQVRSSE